MDKIIIVGGDGSYGREMAREHIRHFKAEHREILVLPVTKEEEIRATRLGNRYHRHSKKLENKNKSFAAISAFLQGYAHCKGKKHLQQFVINEFKKFKRANRHLNIPLTNLSYWIETNPY